MPPSSPEPLAIEKAFRFAQDISAPSTNTGTVAESPPFDTWTATPPSLPSINDYISRVHLITIPSNQVQNILKVCRHLSITLTGLLHGLIISYFSRTIPSSQGFRAVTPYSMRRFTQTSNDEIVNHISYITTDWKEPLISSVRRTAEGSKEEEAAISQVSSQFQISLLTELSNIPTRGPSALIEISKISDFDKSCEESMKGKRGYTYELSNIGVVEIPERKEGDLRVRLENLAFTQCGMVAGPAVGCSVVSVKGGPLILSLHWQEGVVGEGFMEDMKGFLERGLLGLGDEI